MNLLEELALSRKNEPIAILHGTDWWTDCDDITALRLLCNAHKAGAITLLGVGINSVMDESAASVSAFTDFSGVKVPIGVDRRAIRDASRCLYQKTLVQYPHSVNSNEECEEAYKLYRRLLAQSDKKVHITEVGFPSIIHELLISEPDEYSPLTGMELVSQKVERIWMMAGKWDENPGKEYNFSAYREAREAGAYICRYCPVPITFLGFEVGCTVITGNRLPEDDIMYHAFVAHGSKCGRFSWDPMTVLLAIINQPEKAGYCTVSGRASVDAETGFNTFIKDETGIHTYVVKNKPDAYYAQQINDLL